MATTYPVEGYRTKSARAKAFKPQAPNRQVEDLLRRAFDPPWGPRRAGRTPRRSLTTRELRLIRDVGTVLRGAAARHPALRAAQIAWRAGRFLPFPTAAIQGSSDAVAQAEAAGFEACITCTPSPPTHQWVSDNTACGTVGCYTRQAVSGEEAIGAAIGTNRGTLVLWKLRVGDPFGERYDLHWHGVRDTPGTALAEGWHIRPGILELTANADPMPLPWALAAANARPNTPAREAGYGPPQTPQKPKERLRQDRAGPRRKDKKISLLSGGALRNAIELGFEGTEWVGIVHKALPPDCRTGNLTVEQLRDIYRCWDRVDGCKAIEGALNNYIEDNVIGQLGKAGKAAAQRTGRATGPLGFTRPAQNRPKGHGLWIPKVSLGCGEDKEKPSLGSLGIA